MALLARGAERWHARRVRELPGGTLTFLFTDVEGSTRLLHELGAEGYAQALAEHRRVVRAAFRRHGGVEVDTQVMPSSLRFRLRPVRWRLRRRCSTGSRRVAFGCGWGCTGTPFLARRAMWART